MSSCPECDTRIHVTEEVEVGQIVLCPDCQVPLEITSHEPVALTLLPELTDGHWAD